MNLFESRFVRLFTMGAGLAVMQGFTGCGGPPPNTYPSSPPSASAMPAAPSTATPAAPSVLSTTVVKVPPDAIELSQGDYPPPGFPAPAQAGLIMVVDMNGDPTTAVASTAVTGADAGKPMSITDVANMTITMNKFHKYRVVFVPNKP